MTAFIMERMIVFRLVWQKNSNDYYVGRYAAIYSGDQIIWSGYSNDAVEDILKAVGVLFESYEGEIPEWTWL